MSIKLARNETVIKEYNYATTTEGLFNKRETKNTVIVTDKRIIKRDVCEKSGYEKVENNEIAIGAVTGVTAKASSSFKFIFLVLGIIFGIAGFFMVTGSFYSETRYDYELSKTITENKVNFGSLLFALIFLALAAFLIYKFVTSRMNVLICDFTVADRTNVAMSAGSASYNSIFSRFFISGRSKFVRIVVDAAIAKEFVDEIGSIILDVQNGLTEQSDGAA